MNVTILLSSQENKWVLAQCRRTKQSAGGQSVLVWHPNHFIKSILLVAPCHRSCDRLLQMCMSFFLYIFCLFSLSSVADSYSRGYSRFTGVWRCLLHLQVTTCRIGGDAHRKNRMVTEDRLLIELKMEL